MAGGARYANWAPALLATASILAGCHNRQANLGVIQVVLCVDPRCPINLHRWQADQSASAAEGGNRPTPAQLREWLKNAQTERVLEALDAIAQAAADNELQHQTAMLSARHSRLELSLLKGVISADNAKLEANQINDALLHLIAQLPQP